MADTAYQTAYRHEFIAGFEARQSLLRMSVTTEAVVKGNQAVFLIADSGNANAVTRGVNGRIPGRPDNLTQVTATLEEWHDVPERTAFNIFASQGDGRQIMQMSSMSVINRKTDSLIINQLNTGTVGTGAAATASLLLITKAKTILGNSSVPHDGQITGLITPAFEAYLVQNVPQFASADYVTARPIESGETAWSDQPKMYSWLGVNWIVHPNLPNKGTSAEKCFLYHRSAIGHAMGLGEEFKCEVGYEGRDDYSWARCSGFMGAKLLQNSGVVVMNHDGSALVAA